MCSKLENSRLRVVIVPNAAHDLLCLQVFPTPALKNLDFGISEELSEVNCLFNALHFAVV